MESNLRLFDHYDGEIANHVHGLMRTIITASYQKQNNSKVSQALLAFVARNAGSWKSLNSLVAMCKSEDEFKAVALDCGAMIRCMFDAYLQAAYIVHDPGKREERASLYLEYEHVERYRQVRGFLAQNNPLLDIVKNSPRRREAEPRVKAEYDRVKANYPGRGSDGVRNHWYPGSLYDLAEQMGKQEQYEWFVNPFHGCVHSGPFAVYRGPGLPGAGAMYFAVYALAQTAQLLVDIDGLTLTDEDRQLLDACATDLLQVRQTGGQPL